MDFWYPLSPFRAIIHININNSHNPMGISLDWRHALIIHRLNLLSSINAFFFCGPRTVFTTQHVRMKTERNTNLFKTKNKKWGEHTVGLCFVLALFFDLWSLSRVKPFSSLLIRFISRMFYGAVLCIFQHLQQSQQSRLLNDVAYRNNKIR